MGELNKVGSLEVDQDLEFTRKDWTAQRIGWGVIALMLIAGLAGVFGHGPVAFATVEGEKGVLKVEHHRVIRHGTDYETIFRIAPELTSKKTVSLWLSRDYLEKREVRNFEPEPDKVEGDSDRLVYTFSIGETGQPIEVRFTAESNAYGPIPGRGGIVGGPDVALDAFAMP